MAVSNVIGEEHLTKINAALAAASEALREAELAKRAGFDVAAQVAALTAGAEKLRAIKSVYFPNAL